MCAARVEAAAGGYLARARSVRVCDYVYDLPASRIASRPVSERSSSRLLVAAGPGTRAPSAAEHHVFRELPDLLPRGSRVVLNNSRTVPARVPMRRASGARAEVFLLAPASGDDPAPALRAPLRDGTHWNCLIGGRRIRTGDVLETGDDDGRFLRAEVIARDGAAGVVRFRASTPSLAEALALFGKTPLPPYIKREADDDDARAYQTVCAQTEGSVAAPTAGLHFTPELLKELRGNGTSLSEVTLHVGAGTFLQVDGATAGSHNMHEEHVSVSTDEIRKIANDVASGAPVVAVGTTSVRTLESMYWHGVKLLKPGRLGMRSGALGFCDVDQWEPYEILDCMGEGGIPAPGEALAAAAQHAEDNKQSRIQGRTRLLIVPSVDLLVTNFHQPRSTLLMLVAAFCGGREVLFDAYDAALRNDYRFLSYGDSSLYFRA